MRGELMVNRRRNRRNFKINAGKLVVEIDAGAGAGGPAGRTRVGTLGGLAGYCAPYGSPSAESPGKPNVEVACMHHEQQSACR
jgi:hypothetical protein